MILKMGVYYIFILEMPCQKHSFLPTVCPMTAIGCPCSVLEFHVCVCVCYLLFFPREVWFCFALSQTRGSNSRFSPTVPKQEWLDFQLLPVRAHHQIPLEWTAGSNRRLIHPHPFVRFRSRKRLWKTSSVFTAALRLSRTSLERAMLYLTLAGSSPGSSLLFLFLFLFRSFNSLL